MDITKPVAIKSGDMFDWSTKTAVYNRLPQSIRPLAKDLYFTISEETPTDEIHTKFVNEFFDSEAEYNRFQTELDKSEIYRSAVENARDVAGERSAFEKDYDSRRELYPLIRKLQPDTIVETGVANGYSSFFILLALHKNSSGVLHSIDFPKGEQSTESFQEELNISGSVSERIPGGGWQPADKNPGWVVPDQIRDPWSLHIGRSQRQLPKVLTDLKSIDFGIHDSEHSVPCMLFEFELLYEWLSDGGVLISDDINWNDAFETFCTVRGPQHGRVYRQTGYIRKQDGT